MQLGGAVAFPRRSNWSRLFEAVEDTGRAGESPAEDGSVAADDQPCYEVVPDRRRDAIEANSIAKTVGGRRLILARPTGVDR